MPTTGERSRSEAVARQKKRFGATGLQDRKDEILQKAAEIFQRKGYRATTLNDVAGELGFTRQAIYYYFAHKQQLLLEMHDRIMRIASEMLDSIYQSNLPADEKLRQMLRAHVRAVVERQPFFAIYYHERSELPPDRLEMLTRVEREYLRKFEDVLRLGMDQGIFDRLDPKVVSLALMSMCLWVCQWYRDSGPLTPDEIAATFYGLLALRTKRGL